MGKITHGMDPQMVEDLGRFLQGRATDLDQLAASVDQRIRTTTWIGGEADQFVHQWWPVHRNRVLAAAEAVRGLGQSALNNVAEQRRASDAGGYLGGGWGGQDRGTLGLSARFIREMEDRLARRAEIERVSHLSPGEQAAWWNGLTAEEQQAFISATPQALLALRGLPSDARVLASMAVVEASTSTIVLSSTEYKAHGDATIKIIRIQAGVEAQIREYADGHVEVELRSEAGAGVGVPKDGIDASATLNGTSALTYQFGDRVEADAFLDGLIQAPVPDSLGDSAALGLAALVPGGVSTYGASEMKEYLDGFVSHETAAEYGIESRGALKVSAPGGPSIDVEGAYGASWDRVSQDTTFYLKNSGEAGLGGDLPGLAGSLKGDQTFQVVVDKHGDLKSMAITSDYATATGVGGVGFASTEGSSGSMKMTVDLTDPAVKQSSMDLLRSASGGDLSGSSDALSHLYDRSEVVLAESATSSNKFGFDAGVAKASVESTTATTTRTFIKPPGGTFVGFDAGGGSSR